MSNSKAESRAQESRASDLKQFTRSKFAWLEQVAHDPELPASAFKVAWAISQHLNHQTSEAFPGTDRIAGCIAMSQGTVIDMVKRLAGAGHLVVIPGRRGRGNSNRYRMIVKAQPADISDNVKPRPADISADDKKAQTAMKKPQPSELKPQPADMNTFNNTFTDTGAGLQPAPLVETEVVKLHVRRLMKISGCNASESEMLAAFELALEAGFTPNDILERWIDEDPFDTALGWLTDLASGPLHHIPSEEMDDPIPF